MQLGRRHRHRSPGQRAASGASPDQDHRPGSGRARGFPADYPWQDNKGQQFSQIGNAVFPRTAAHLLAPRLNKPFNPDDFTLAA
uniref:hypothetical protein n=1 Tax=Streptomyces doebereineriae TaxID=3075528 RepID=UPI00374DFE98